MKKLSVMALFVILFSGAGLAQGLYSKTNLDQASKEDLSLYLAKAQKLKKTGGVVTAVGASTAVAGLVFMFLGGEGGGYTGFYIIMAGTGAAVIGIPINATGYSRVRKVSNVINTKFNTVHIDLAPCGFYNMQTKNVQPGISLKIRF